MPSPCDWRPEQIVMPQYDGNYSTIARCEVHQRHGKPYHRRLVDGLTWDHLRKFRLIPAGAKESAVRRGL